VIRRLLATRPATLALALVAVVFAIDLNLPLGVAAAVPYTFAVLIALGAKPGWVGPAVAGLCGVLTVAKMEIVPERGTTEMWKVLVNRGLALFAIGMTTLLGLLRRQAEAAARAHEADLARMGRLAVAGELATVLAHELNQPLAAVCLQADIAARLAGEQKPHPELNEALREVAEQSRRAAEIVRTIRQTVRRGEPQRGAVDVNEAVRAVVRLLDWKARRASVAVEVHLADAVPPTHGDRVQIEQVIFNLLQNAIEAVVARGDGPRLVRIETATATDAILLRVRDTGLGLRDPDRVFERFYTTKPDGMGLGLAISRSAVEAHGGRLWAENISGGAEFAFTLPAYRGDAA
jgi:C4-dicarboxylate-specific signal transduction histidine kinase